MSVSITELADCCQTVWQQSVSWSNGHSVSHWVSHACLPVSLSVCLSHQRSSVLPCCAAWPLLLAHWNEEIWQQRNLPLLAGHPKVKKWVPILELDQYKRHFATIADITVNKLSMCHQLIKFQIQAYSQHDWQHLTNGVHACTHTRTHTHTHTHTMIIKYFTWKYGSSATAWK